MSWKFKVFGSFLVVVAITITLFYNQYVLAPISYQPTDLSDAVIIVTGGTSGIGLETVRKFVEWNGTVIMPVRNLRKGEIVRKEILSTSMHLSHKGKIELIEMDLTSFASVRNFATKILERKIHIDILVLNAVGMQADINSKAPVVTVDGIEMVYQVNHLSHFLLARLLLPALSMKPSRIVHVSSSVHYLGRLDHEAYSSTSLNVMTSRLGGYSYFDTKLMNVIFSNGFQRKMTGYPQYSHLTSVSVHPGLVVSELDRESEFAPYLKSLREMIARPTTDGAIAQVTVATFPEIIQLGGGLYFEDHCIMNHCTKSILSRFLPVYFKGGLTPHSAALNVTEQEWLWNTSSDIVGLPRDLF